MKTPNQARRDFARRVRKWGEDIVIKWEEGTGGTVNPLFGDRTGGTVNELSLTQKADVHIIAATTAIRQFAEIQTGDAIITFPYEFYRVSAVGTTSLTVDQVLDEFALASANSGQATPATAATTRLDDLEKLHFEFGGKTWKQADVGEKLSAIWDALIGGIRFANVIAVRST